LKTQKNKTKEIVSFILLFTIIPLLLIPGLTFVINKTASEIIDFFFAFGVSALMLYAMYELIFAVKTSRKIDFNDKTLNDQERSQMTQPDTQS